MEMDFRLIAEVIAMLLIYFFGAKVKEVQKDKEIKALKNDSS